MSSSGPSATADALSAASLLLAVLGVLYGLWYREISETLGTEVPTHLEDAGEERRRVKIVLYTRVVPLAVSTMLVALVFLPEAVRLIVHAGCLVRNDGFAGALQRYDPVPLSLVLVVFGVLALGIHTSWLAVRLIMLKRKLRYRT